MITPARRITLYGLLLLVPTLVVGGGAIFLLRREQARLAERGAFADEARRVALTERARLVAENIELLVGDVQTGLLDTLSNEPAANLNGFLAQWEQANPLVRVAFRATPNGAIAWPDRATGGENAQGFLRRFASRYEASPPWGTATAPTLLEQKRTTAPEPVNDARERQQLESKVLKTQSARRDVQEWANSRNYAPMATDLSSRSQRAEAAPASASGTLAAAAPKREAQPDRRGWDSWPVEGRWHVLGWVQPSGGGEVRGVELEMTALISRLAEALPSETNLGEGYALRDAQQRIMHQAGAIPAGVEPVARVPFSTPVLSGWDVVGFLTLEDSRASGGGGVFIMGSLLVGIFVTAILAGGSLLLWQARRSEAEAAQKTSFVANVSHEFKTPLTTIRLYTELLAQGRVRDAAQSADYLRTVGRETQRLARLVNNALDFSQLEQGRKKFARERLDLAAELERLLDTHEPRLAEAGLVLRRDVPTVPVEIATDRDAVQQIVINLLDNACKYAAQGGEVVVSLMSRSGGAVVLTVADRGPGVAVGQREQIFEKFHRVDQTLTAEKSGAGLGLSIARQLARGLGGTLRCEAREGGGAAFILELS